MTAAAEALGRHLDLASVGYVVMEPDEDTAVVGGEYNDGRLTDLSGFRFRLSRSRPDVAPALRAGEDVFVEKLDGEVGAAPGSSEVVRGSAVRSGAVIPLNKDGRLVAWLYGEHPEPREWSEEERLLFRDVAERTWDAVERARAREEARDSASRLERLADAAPAMLWVNDTSNRCVFLSRGWYEFTGQAEGEGLGLGWLDAVHPDDRDRAARRLFEAARERRPTTVDIRLRRANGHYSWVMDAGRPWFEDGEWRGYVGTVVDIHDRKLAAEALRRSESRQRFLLELGDRLLMYADAYQVMRVTTEAVGRHLGVAAAGYNVLDADDETGEVATAYNEGRLPGPVPGQRFILGDRPPGWGPVLRSGGAVFIEDESLDPRDVCGGEDSIPGAVRACAGVPLMRGGRLAAWVYLLHDSPRRWSHADRQLLRDVAARSWTAVERARAEEKLREANQAKGRFLSFLSHELRTPLTGVIGYADLLESEMYGPTTAKQKEAVARIKSSAWYLVSIVDEVLTLTRAEAGREEVRPADVDLAGIVADVVRILEPQAHAHGLAMHLEGAEPPLPVRSDPGKIRQLLINLVGNAVKYTEQGSITVRLDSSSSETVEIHVVDTGPGIAPEDQERIFEPFTQVSASYHRSQGGTGLGLAISRRLARLMGGDVTLRSAPGEGSTFTLRLSRHLPG